MLKKSWLALSLIMICFSLNAEETVFQSDCGYHIHFEELDAASCQEDYDDDCCDDCYYPCCDDYDLEEEDYWQENDVVGWPGQHNDIWFHDLER